MFSKTFFVLSGLVVLCVGVCWSTWSTPVLVSKGIDTTSNRCVAFRVTPNSEAVSKNSTDSVSELHNWNPTTDIHGEYLMRESYSTNDGSTWKDTLVACDQYHNAGMWGPSLIGNGKVLHATWIEATPLSLDCVSGCSFIYWICYSRGKDFGQHFFTPDSIPTKWRYGRDSWPQDEFPHLAVNTTGDGKKVMIVYRDSTHNYPVFNVSTDSGFTWSKNPVAIDSDTVSLTNVTYTNNNNTQDRFVVVYSKTITHSAGAPTYKICSIYTTNGGTSWTGKTVISPSTDSSSDFPVVAADPNGNTVMCVWRKVGSKTLKSARSTDAGATWSFTGQLLGAGYPADDDSVSPWPSLSFVGGIPMNFLCAWASKHGSSYRDIYVSNWASSWTTPTSVTSANSSISYHGPRVSWYGCNTGPYMFITFARDTSEFADSLKSRHYSIWETQELSPTIPNGLQSQLVVQGGVLAPMVRVNPNPAAGPVKISFSLGAGHEIGLLKVYTVTGELVKTFPLTASGNELRWDLKDERGKPVTNGVYFLRLEGVGAILSEKIVVMR